MMPWTRLLIVSATLLMGGLVTFAVSGEGAFRNPGQQDQPARELPGADRDTVQLVFDREVFSYPSHARRNPFRPLTGAADAGPRFEELWLMGTMVDSAPGASVALMGRIGGTTASATYRLRVGERLGNIRVIEIRTREVVVEVEEFGMRERHTMEQRRTAPEAQGGQVPDTPPPGQADTMQADTTTPPPDTVPPTGGRERGAGPNGTGGN
jgi:hypothetical protein